MTVNVGQLITEAEYTTLRSGINLVMGTPTGTGTDAAGYNQAITAPAVSPGDTITATGKSHTVTSVTYDSTNNWTNIAYTIVSGSAFATGETISNTGASNYQLVGETRFKANTSLYAQFSLSGSLSNKTLGTVDMKLEVTRTGSSGVGDNDNQTTLDYIHEVSGFIMGAR